MPNRLYGQSRDIVAKVYEGNEDFEKELDHLATLADQQAVALLLQLDLSKRHSSGLVLKKNEEGTIIAYIFDTMGLSLPAQPCGFRTKNINNNLFSVINALKNKEIPFLITSINLRIYLQKNLYSCLFATILFFEAIIKNEIIITTAEDYTAVYGKGFSDFKDATRYAIKYSIAYRNTI